MIHNGMRKPRPRQDRTEPSFTVPKPSKCVDHDRLQSSRPLTGTEYIIASLLVIAVCFGAVFILSKIWNVVFG